MSQHHSIEALKAIATVVPAALIIQSASGSGVCGHSSTEFWGEYAIFSVGNNKVVDAAFKTWMLERKIGFKELFGSYKGATESSFIARRSHLLEIAKGGWLNGQESILLLDAPTNMGGGKFYRRAHLLFLETGELVSIGKFKQAGREKAMQQDGWTFDPSNQTYWICE